MVAGYEYDVFVSYSRRGNAGDWVQNHLSKVLSNCLVDELGQQARLFVDRQMRTGEPWPQQLADGVSRSKVMVAVWSPPYFQSEWCMAEIETMRAREKLLGRTGFIFPIVFADGRNFPRWAAELQSRDFKEWSFPYPSFRDTHPYLEFHKAVRDLATEIAGRLPGVPDWSTEWPVLREVAPHTLPRAALPEL